jgi:rare lipoprotein A (peptidoglycan hydrolase)
MIKPQLNQISRDASQLVTETCKELKQAAITSEEHIRKGVSSSVRTIVASLLFCVTGIVSFGVNVTNAVAHRSLYRDTHGKAIGTPKHHKHHRHHRVSMEATSANHLRTASTTGTASWYGGKFQHRRTASGKRFDTNRLMAAHKTLPFGTKVRVTNLDNAQTVIVEITDRGPYVGDRIIDVSHAAALELGFADLGTANVKLDILRDEEEGIAENFIENSTEIAIQ